MADLPGWTWAPRQSAVLANGERVIVLRVRDNGTVSLWAYEDGCLPAGTGHTFDGAIPDPDGVGMGEWALEQVPHSDVVLDIDGWTVWLTPMAHCRGPTLYAACAAVARARGGWGR